MGFFEIAFFQILGAVVLISGLYALARSKLTIGLGETDDFNRTVSGQLARWLALGYVGAGCSFFFNIAVGAIATLSITVLAWALGKSGGSLPHE